jgi:hypothetical protein
MTLSNQITFINDLIREDPEITIREYLEAVQEIDIIEKTQSDMGRRPMDSDKKQQVLDMAMSAKYEVIHEVTGVSIAAISRIIKDAGINQDDRKTTIRALQIEKEKKHWEARISAPKSQKRFIRPPAEYSNSRPYDSLHQIKTA